MFTTVHTATVSRLGSRYITCERCGCEFAFRMELEAKGTANDGPYGLIGGGRQGALDDANRKAHTILGKEPAACPDCNWYQTKMLPELRRRHLAWLRWSGLAGLVAAAICGGLIFRSDLDELAYILQPLGAGLAALGALLFGAHFAIARRHDPNAGWPGHLNARHDRWPAARTPEYQSQIAARQWYCTQGGAPYGPVSHDKLLELLTTGRLNWTDTVWRDPMPQWQRASEGLLFREQ